MSNDGEDGADSNDSQPDLGQQRRAQFGLGAFLQLLRENGEVDDTVKPVPEKKQRLDESSVAAGIRRCLPE